MQKIILWFTLILTLCLTACNLQSQETAALAAPDPPTADLATADLAAATLATADSATADSATADSAASTAETCPVTQPPDPRFIPPEPYPEYPSAGQFWYGNEALWTVVPENGEWYALPHNAEGYTQKVFWWQEDYSWQEEPQPQLTVTGRRLDASAPPLNVSRATNAFAEDIQSAMLVGVDFPTLGCWEITGHYEGHELSFVIFVAP